MANIGFREPKMIEKSDTGDRQGDRESGRALRGKVQVRSRVDARFSMF